jgi:DNA-binding response OmpR family regulator
MQAPSNEHSDSPDILIVDDVPENLHLLSRMLKDRGYKVRVAPNGLLALEAIRTMPPDLILLDINMPELNGYETCERLKVDPALKEIPVIFISALNETTEKVKSFAVGGVDYVTKPFQFEEVDARVRTHLHLRRLQLELATHNERLEETVRIRTREITEARDQLAEARNRLAILDQAKSDFLSLISHELRTPLNGLLGITDLIMEEGSALPSMGDLHEHFHHSRARILTIVDDALLLTQIDVEARKFASEHAGLSLALQNAIERSREFATFSNVSIGTPPVISEQVVGQAEVLSKALEALLETGVRFSQAGNDLKLSCTASPARVLLSVEATGYAIPKQFLSRFFDVLAIKDSIVPGGDLGLRPAVAERIISLFGGSVTVENVEPAGIRLNISLLRWS